MMKRFLLQWLFLMLVPVSMLAQENEASTDGAKTATNHNLEAGKNLDIFNMVYRNIDLFYVDTINPEQAITAAIKGMKSPVAGDADCLVFPNLEASNVFYKCCTKFDKSEVGAMLMGAKVPCVLSSRGDTSKTKLYSIALAAMMA